MKDNRIALLTISFTVFIDILGFAIIVPLVALYGKHFHASNTELAILGSIFSLMQFLFSPFWGTLSDHFGRRPIILASLLGSVFSYVLFALAGSFSLLLFSRALAGIFAANISTAHACAADLSEPTTRLKTMGMLGAAIGLGFTIGPMVGGLSAAHIGLAWPGWIAAILCFFNFLAALEYLPETHPEEKRTPNLSFSFARIPLSQKTPLRLQQTVALYFLCITSFSLIEQVFSLFLQSKLALDTARASATVGYIMLIMGVANFLVQGFFVRRYAKQDKEKFIFVLGISIVVVGLLFFAQATGFLGFALASTAIATGTALINPVITTLISEVDPDSQGKNFGLAQSFGSLGRIVGPFFGISFYGISISLPFLISGILYIIAVVWALTTVFNLSADCSPIDD